MAKNIVSSVTGQDRLVEPLSSFKREADETVEDYS
jgi:hypothetical protein